LPFINTQEENLKLAKNTISSLFFYCNFYYFFETDYFNAVHLNNYFLHFWFIANLVQFYIIYPVIFIFSLKISKNFCVTILLTVTIFSFFLAQMGGNLSFKYPFFESKIFFNYVAPWAYFLPFTRIWVFLLGGLIYFTKNNNNQNHSWVYTVLSFFLFSFSLYYINSDHPYPSYLIFPIVIFFYFVVKKLNSNSSLIVFLKNKILVFIGVASYSIYLIHYPLILILREYFPTNIVIMFLITLFIFSICFIFHKKLESKIRPKCNFINISSMYIIIVFICIFLLYDNSISKTAGNVGFINGQIEAEIASEYFNKNQTNDFNNELNKTKLLIIGDSYASDFLNCLTQLSILDKIQVSTFRIPANCGNLYVKSDLTKYIKEKHIASCCNIGWYSSSVLLDRIRSADYIVLASLWKKWQIPFFQESFNNLKSITSAEVLFLGPKCFGDIKIDNINPTKNTLNIQNKILEKNRYVNNKMKQIIPANSFVDTQSCFLDDFGTVPIFTDNGNLISYDGQHLTNKGAKYFGRKLINSHSNLNFLNFE
tara:strand:- start:2175 stop:3791 length:1617 start_codon:yes stop_codon:yes gene_type:complete